MVTKTCIGKDCETEILMKEWYCDSCWARKVKESEKESKEWNVRAILIIAIVIILIIYFGSGISPEGYGGALGSP